MTEYSYSDLVKMQDQAIRRVREMQERAQRTVRETSVPDLPTPQTITEKSEDVTHESGHDGEIKEPANKESVNRESIPKAAAAPAKQTKDHMILLALLMLLSAEGADNSLLIALLYILS